MSADSTYEDKGYFRRKFPRRKMRRQIGILSGGQYFLAECNEIGEGGLSFTSEFILNEGDQVVVSIQVPGADFISVRAEIRTTQKKDSEGLVIHGVSFTNIQFAHKRMIRSFVSDHAEGISH